MIVLGLLAGLIALPAANAQAGVNLAPPDEQGRYRYLVEFAEPGLLASRAPAESGRQLAITEAANAAALNRLQAEHADYRASVASLLGRQPEITHHYLVTHSGMALWLHAHEAEKVASLPGVVSVERDQQYELSTFRGPWFIGAHTLWDGSAVPHGMGVRGEGMTVAVLDTGIDPGHPSFANAAECGHGEGDTPPKVLSYLHCATTDANGLCNGPAPTDTNGHGSHVSSTAVGNRLDSSAIPAPPLPAPFTEMSGVAPCAHLRSYKVCPSNSCDGAQIVAGMNSILLHGDVDVMNFSISGGQMPWTDHNRIMLDLVDAGVLVATAAGNTGPGVPDPVGLVQHRGPWLLSVASISHDGIGSGLLSASGPGQPPANTQDLAATRGSDSPSASAITDLPIRHYDGQPSHAEGCTAGEDGAPPDLAPFPAGYFDNAAALIHRGICPFAVKINNAFAAGAELVIVRNNEPGELMMTTTGQAAVPAYSLQQAPGQALQAFVTANPATATIDFTALEGDVLSEFSLRGPTPSPLQHLTKPDIAAPGDFVLAAIPGGYGSAGGTSMASPHIAGGAALMRQIHPGWSVAEINSAMTMTAHREGLKDDSLTPWDWDDVGSGRANLTRAARAGLVMHETVANYLAANPAGGGDVRTLNTPSVRDLDCTPDCTWNRTLRNTLESATHWTATASVEGFHVSVWPNTFSFNGDPSETQALTITAIPGSDQTAAVQFGEIIFTESGGNAPPQHITVAVSGLGSATFVMALDPPQLGVCTPDSGQIQMPVAAAVDAVGSYSGSVNLTAGSLPGGVGSQITPQSVAVPGIAEWLLEVSAGASVGQHVLTLSGNDGSQARTAELALALDSPLTGSLTLSSPPDGAADLGLQPPFAWNAMSNTQFYQLQVATDAAFADVVIDRNLSGTSFTPAIELQIGTQYFWRARATNHCGDSDWSDVFSFTTRLQPEALVGPMAMHFTVPVDGGSATDDLSITNTGTGNLVWNIVQGQAGTAGMRGDEPTALDETLALPDFTVAAAINGGGPVNFSVPAGIINRGEVTGFSFAGTAQGISGSNSRASDTCLRITSPAGQVITVGGSNGSMDGCGDRPWAFHGPGSGNDGSYESTHVPAFQPPAADAGEWSFTAVNDWTGSTASDINWTEVTLTLHKTPWPYCDSPGDVPWLDVATTGGSTPADQTDQVNITVNGTGLAPGRHFAALCLTTNDPARLLIVVPVTLDVGDGGPGDRIFGDRFE